MTKRECAHCGETYHAARLRAAKGYCSGRCRTAAHRAANAPTADHELTYGHIGQAPVHWECAKCGGTWLRYPRGACSVASEMVREAAAERPLPKERTETTIEDPFVVVHYAPGDRPLCGSLGWTAIYTDEPDQVAGCGACLELVAEDLEDTADYLGRCLHCRQEISATGGGAWRRVVRAPCPHCGMLGW